MNSRWATNSLRAMLQWWINCTFHDQYERNGDAHHFIPNDGGTRRTDVMRIPSRLKVQPIQGEQHGLSTRRVSGAGLGAVVGVMFPEVGKSLKPLGDGFIKLIKMMIAPVIFCTIVLGIGSIAKAATVGKVGGLALIYFLVMSTFALAIGLVVGNIIHPGEGLKLIPYDPNAKAATNSTVDFLMGIIPSDIPVLPTLLAAILVGFALQKMGTQGAPILKAIGHGQALGFRILIMIMWLAPVGAFGAIAAVVGATGVQAIVSMFTLMVAFYITCALFIVVILGGLL